MGEKPFLLSDTGPHDLLYQQGQKAQTRTVLDTPGHMVPLYSTFTLFSFNTDYVLLGAVAWCHKVLFYILTLH